MIAFVTGANGFVGRAVVRALVADGHEVVAAVRVAGESALPNVRTAIVGDLADATSLAQHLRGADVVIHLAARTHVLHDRAQDPMAAYRRGNVVATNNVVRAAQSAGVKRLVFMSSIKVLGNATSIPFTDQSPPAPDDAYGITKFEAEQVVAEAGSLGIETCILRPPLVFGPAVGGNFARLISLARVASRVPLPLASIRNRRSMIFVENLARAVVRSATHALASGKTYLVADDPPISTPDLIRGIARAMGRSVHLVPFPVQLLRAGGSVLGRSGEVSRITESLEVDAARFRAEVGPISAVSFDEALRRTVSGRA